MLGDWPEKQRVAGSNQQNMEGVLLVGEGSRTNSGTRLTEGPSGDSSRGVYCICLYGPPLDPPQKNPEMLFELLKTFCCLTKLVQQPDIHASIFLKSILAHQLRLCLIIKKVWGPLQPLLVRKDQRRGDCSPLPVGVVSEFIACCALCGRNFFFISQRTAWLIIKALSIA